MESITLRFPVDLLKELDDEAAKRSIVAGPNTSARYFVGPSMPGAVAHRPLKRRLATAISPCHQEVDHPR